MRPKTMRDAGPCDDQVLRTPNPAVRPLPPAPSVAATGLRPVLFPLIATVLSSLILSGGLASGATHQGAGSAAASAGSDKQQIARKSPAGPPEAPSPGGAPAGAAEPSASAAAGEKDSPSEASPDASSDGSAPPDASDAEGDATGCMTEYHAKSFTVPAGRTVRGDRYFFGNGSDIDGTLDGDFFVFSGSDNNITGAVTGDVNAFSSNLSVSGEVGDDVRVMAGDVNIKGKIGGDLLAMAGQIRVQKGASIRGLTSVGGGQIVLSGAFRQNVKAAGGQVVFGGTAEQDVEIEADVLKVEPGAHIAGNLTYKAREELESLREGGESRKMVAGTVTYLPKAAKKPGTGSHGTFHWLWEIWTFLTAFVLGCLLIAMARRPVIAILETTRKETLKSIGFGLIGHIFAPFAGLILILLCVTFPVGILVLIAWGVLFYLGKLVVAAALADALLRKLGRTPSPYLALLLGMFPVWFLFSIPVLGSLLYWFVAPIVGIGAILVGLRTWSRGKPARAQAPPPSDAPTEVAPGI